MAQDIKKDIMPQILQFLIHGHVLLITSLFLVKLWMRLVTKFHNFC